MNTQTKAHNIVGSSDRLLHSARESCDMLSISRTTFYELVAAGSLQVVRIGRSVRVPRSELERFVRERMEGN
jgi:excisionase family DNA binding protein